MLTEPEEYKLALRARTGDRAALAALVEAVRTRLFALAYAELRHYDDAHDAVAAALLQVCAHVGELREPARMRGWVNVIVRNEIRRLLRKARSSEPLPPEWRDGSVPQDPVLRLDVERALSRLPQEQARAIRLFYLSGFSLEEIAERVGHPEGTVKSWLHRGRRRLALELEGYAPMTTSSPTPVSPARAAVLHTDLEPAQTARVRRALAEAGYEAIAVSPEELARLQAALLERDYQALDTWLHPYRIVVMDERLAGRSIFEYLINGSDYFHTRRTEGGQVGLCLLLDAPDDFTLLAAWHAGVDGVIDKAEDLEDLRRVAERLREGRAPVEQPFTERARRVLDRAQAEAARVGQAHVDTEHLLLALTREADHTAARLLERLGISLTQLRERLDAGAPRETAFLGGQNIRLLPPAQRVMAKAFEEAQLLGQRCLGTEHLLLGLLGEPTGNAGMVLRELGITRERILAELRSVSSRGPGAPVSRLSPMVPFTEAQVAAVLPLLPVRDTVYLPHHLYYLVCEHPAMVQAAKAAQRSEGWVLVVAQRDPAVEVPSPEMLYATGGVARILEVAERADGTLRLSLEVQARARVTAHLQTEPFLQVRIAVLEEPAEPVEEIGTLAREVRELFHAFAKQRSLGAETRTYLTSTLAPGRLADLVAPYLDGVVPFLQKLLETASPRARLETLREVIRSELSAWQLPGPGI